MNTKKIAVVVCVTILVLSSIPLWFAEVEEETSQEERDFPDGTPGDPGGGPDCQWGVPGYEPWYYYVGDMINVWCGNLLLPQVDLSVGARGYRMQIIRTYNSHNNLVNGPFGYGWTYNYNLYFMNVGVLTYYDGDGSTHSFTTMDGINYTPPAGKSLNVTLDPSMLIRLREKTGTNYSFDSSNKLTLITDQYGNSLNVSYDFMSRITSISDDSNLMLNFTYNGTLISSITDALNRTIQYSYDVFGNLVNVTYPNNGTIQYSYYPDRTMNYTVDQVGRKMRFTYDPLSIFSSRVKNVTYSYIEGGNESTPYEAYNLTYGLNYTLVRNARGYSTNISLDSNGQPTKIDGPKIGSIFLDVYGTGEALEEPASSCGATKGCSGSRSASNACQGRTSCSGADTGRSCPSCGGGQTTMSRQWPKPAEDVFRGFCPRSEIVEIDWDSNLDIRNLTDGLANIYNFTYDSYHNAVSVIDPSQNTTTYEWQNNTSSATYITLLTNITNARNYTGRYSYDNDTNHFALVSYEDALGNLTYYSHDAYGNLANLTDARGNLFQFSFNTHGFLMNTTNPLNETTQYGRDLAGRLSNLTSPGGNVTSYYYDAVDNVIAILDTSGNATNLTYNLRRDRTGVKDANGYWTNYTIDPILAKVTSEMDPTGNSTSNSYDEVGNLLNYTDKRNYTTSYEYDAYNRIANITDPLGNVTKIEYNSDGSVANITDGSNQTYTFSYDSLGRIVNRTDPSGNSTKFKYDEVGNRIEIENAQGYKTTAKYDALNRIINQTDDMGNSTLFDYDQLGNVVNITNRGGHVYKYEYDALGRRTKIFDPLNNTVSFAYDSEGNTVNVTDENGRSTLYEYNSLHRVTKLTNSRGNSTEYAYDAVGNIISMTDVENQTTNLTYDLLNRLISISSPLGHVQNFSYDENGNMLRREDPNGVNVSYQYDEMDRLSLVSYPDGENVTYLYDEEGRILRITNNSGYWENRTYDSLGRLSSLQVVFGPLNKTVSYSYDEVGNRIRVTYPDGYNVSYSFDGNNRVVGINDWAYDNWSITYDSLGRRMRLQYPSGVNVTYSYDNASRLTNILTENSTGTTLLNLTYSYDTTGNVLSFSDGLGNSTTYTIDEDGQLTQVNDSATGLTNYTYDGVGNRLSKVQGANTTSYTYDSDNRLISDGTSNYSFDNNGNMISKSSPAGFANHTYDYDNRLVQVNMPDSSSVEYAYSPIGSLVMRSESGNATFYVNDPQGAGGHDYILAAYNSSGGIISKFVYGPKVDEPLKIYDGAVSLFYHSDLIGSVRMLTNSSESVVERYGYDEFGYPSVQNNAIEEFFLFTGRIWDETTGLYHYRSRWLDSTLGRFTSLDPAGFIDGPNRYIYVRNNPLNNIDPSGNLLCAVKKLAEAWYKLTTRRWTNDKYAHCWAACAIVRDCPWGPLKTFLVMSSWEFVAEVLKRIRDRYGITQIPDHVVGFSREDIRANFYGAFVYSWQFWRGCGSCCKRKFGGPTG